MSFDEESSKVAVVMGGVSSERDISLKSGQAIYQALQEENCPVFAIDLDHEDEQALIDQLTAEQVDIVFIALHGRFGENGELQAILDKHAFLYTGSSAACSRVAFNKVLTQTKMREQAINVPSFNVVSRSEQKNREILSNNIEYPVFVKPAQEGSSIGISYVVDESELSRALELSWRYGDSALIEKAIIGRELTVGIVGTQALPLVEIVPQDGFFDFRAKYEKGKTSYHVPAQLDKELAQQIQKTALEAYDILGCRHFARADFILGEQGAYYFLEMNTIPGFTETSLLPKAAQAIGISFNQLCLKLIGMVNGEKKKNTNIIHSN